MTSNEAINVLAEEIEKRREGCVVLLAVQISSGANAANLTQADVDEAVRRADEARSEGTETMGLLDTKEGREALEIAQSCIEDGDQTVPDGFYGESSNMLSEVESALYDPAKLAELIASEARRCGLDCAREQAEKALRGTQ